MVKPNEAKFASPAIASDDDTPAPRGPFTPDTVQPQIPVLVPEPADLDGDPRSWKKKDVNRVPNIEVCPSLRSLKDIHKRDIDYERSMVAEWKWQCERERAPKDWWNFCMYVGLCGPKPGDPLPPKEWPGSVRRKKMRTKPKAPEEEEEEGGAAERRKKPRAPRPSRISIIKDFKQQAYEQLAAAGGGTVSRDQAVSFARALGYTPSQNDIMMLPDVVEEKAFDDWVSRVPHYDDADDLVKAFAPVVRDKGMVSVFAFNCILASLGEPLTEKEINDMSKLLNSPDGKRFDVLKFLHEITEQNSEMGSMEHLGITAKPPSELPV